MRGVSDVFSEIKSESTQEQPQRHREHREENTEASSNGVAGSARYADFVRYGQKRNELQEPVLVTRLTSSPARFACNRALEPRA